MIWGALWRGATSRLAGPVASAFAVLFAALWLTAAAARGVEASRAVVMETSRDQWKEGAEQATAEAARWRAAFEEAEAARQAEGARSVTALRDQASACALRVEAVRRSASAIAAIVQEEEERDQMGCPVRSLVPVDRLRGALSPGS